MLMATGGRFLRKEKKMEPEVPNPVIEAGKDRSASQMTRHTKVIDMGS